MEFPTWPLMNGSKSSTPTSPRAFVLFGLHRLRARSAAKHFVEGGVETVVMRAGIRVQVGRVETFEVCLRARCRRRPGRRGRRRGETAIARMQPRTSRDASLRDNFFIMVEFQSCSIPGFALSHSTPLKFNGARD